jgi:hypothetical protein
MILNSNHCLFPLSLRSLSFAQTTAQSFDAQLQTVWWIARFEQGSSRRAGYRWQLMAKLFANLTQDFGKGGFDRVGLTRQFCVDYAHILHSAIGEIDSDMAPVENSQLVTKEPRPNVLRKLAKRANRWRTHLQNGNDVPCIKASKGYL